MADMPAEISVVKLVPEYFGASTEDDHEMILPDFSGFCEAKSRILLVIGSAPADSGELVLKAGDGPLAIYGDKTLTIPAGTAVYLFLMDPARYCTSDGFYKFEVTKGEVELSVYNFPSSF